MLMHEGTLATMLATVLCITVLGAEQMHDIGKMTACAALVET